MCVDCALDKHLAILELHRIIDKHRLYIIDDKHIESDIDSIHKKLVHVS